MTLPVLVLVLALCLNGVAAVGSRVLLIDRAAQAARLIGRGADASALEPFEVDTRDGLVCVTVQGSGLFAPTARSCALDAGR